MKLTDILKSMFSSSGDEVWVGESRIDGLVAVQDGSSISIVPKVSVIENANTVIFPERTNVFVGDQCKLTLVSEITYETIQWNIISGDAYFVGGVDTGTIVYIECDSLSDNTIECISTVDDISVSSQISIKFINGIFSGVEIIGTRNIENADPAVFILQSDYAPDSVEWSASGGGTIEQDDSDMMKAFVTPDSSGDDIVISAKLSRLDFNDYETFMPIDVSKCEIVGGVVVERPVIIAPEDWELSLDGEVRCSIFHGENNPDIIEYEIDDSGDDFTSPKVQDDVSYSTKFYIDMDLIAENEFSYGDIYDLRIRYVDDQGSYSLWSDPYPFEYIVQDYIVTTNKLDIFGDSSCIAYYPLDKSAMEVSGLYNGSWVNGPLYADGQYMSSALFTGNDEVVYLNIQDNSANLQKYISLWVSINSAPDEKKVILHIDQDDAGWGNFDITTDTDSKIHIGGRECDHSDCDYQSDIYVSDTAIDVGSFYHIVLSKINDTSYELYINGVLDGTFDFTFYEPDASYRQIIGSFINSSDDSEIYNTFDGAIDQIRVFNRPLSSDDVALLFNENMPITADMIDPFSDSSEILFLKFEDSAADSHNTYNGTWVGDESYSGFVFGNGASFDGSGSCVSLYDNDLSSIVSISFWVNIEDVGNVWNVIVSSKEYGGSDSDNIKFALQSEDMYFETYDSDSANRMICPAEYNTTYHIAIVYTGNDIYDYYVNAELVAELRDDNANLDVAFIGADNDSGSSSTTESAKSIVDNFRAFSRELSQEDVLWLYQEQLEQ